MPETAEAPASTPVEAAITIRSWLMDQLGLDETFAKRNGPFLLTSHEHGWSDAPGQVGLEGYFGWVDDAVIAHREGHLILPEGVYLEPITGWLLGIYSDPWHKEP